MHKQLSTTARGDGIRGARGARGAMPSLPPDFAVIEKRTEAERDKLLLVAYPDFWIFLRHCTAINRGQQ